MGKMLKKLIVNEREDFALGLGLVCGAFVLTHLITAVVMVWLKPDTSVMLSGGILPVLAGVFTLIAAAANLVVDFSLALRCSQTRRRALGLSLSLTAVEAACAMLLAGLLAWAERGFAPALWGWLAGAETVSVGIKPPVPAPPPGVSVWAVGPSEDLFVEPFALAWWWYPVIALGCMAGGLLLGAVIQRFGSRGLWGIWAAWMAVCILGPHLPVWQEHTVLGWMPLPFLAVFAVAALIWSVWSLLHAVVKL